MYKWEAGKFQKLQSLSIIAADAHFFTINTRKFISFSSPIYGNSKLFVYEWKNEEFSNKIQDIQITYVTRCHAFSILNFTYIACGRSVGANAVTVLKWSGTKFEPFQDLRSSFVHSRPHSFTANGTVYLTIPNRRNSRNNHDINSLIYRWDRAKFIHHQSISTHGTMGWDSFTTATGEVFLVMDNWYTGTGAHYNVMSAVYKMVNNKFKLHQQVPASAASYVHAFTHKGKQYLAFVNYYDGKTHTLDSPLFVWN